MVELPPFVDDCDPADEAFIHSSLYRFNAEATGVDDGRTFASVVRDDDGAIVAGVLGATWGGRCEVDVLWVRSDRRGNGLGRALLHGAEAEARRRGATAIVLDTYTFQAPDFYRAEGYVVIAEVDDSPFPPHRKLFFRKVL
jgi:GNAT superfamily N-acetyltransferase